jgi:AraC-like DNA-binding protein
MFSQSDLFELIAKNNQRQSVETLTYNLPALPQFEPLPWSGTSAPTLAATASAMDTPNLLAQSLKRCLDQEEIREAFVCGRQLQPPLYGHVVAFPRLEIPLKGRYENTIDQNGQMTTVCLRPGEVLFAAPNCWNLPTWRLNVELISILFGKKHLGVSLVTGRCKEAPELTVQKFSTPFPLTGPIPHVLNAIVELQIARGPKLAFKDLTLALIRCVREILLNPTPSTSHHAQSLLESICVYLQDHYQYDITRDSVAAEFKVTPNHISRLFQKHGLMTFNGYVTRVRIDRGKYLLCNYNLKLDEVASRCGFRDTPYFCRVFKNLTKTTPAEYRATYRCRTGKSAETESDSRFPV